MMKDLRANKGNGVAVDKLKRDIDRRLNEKDAKYLRNVCKQDTKSPEEYFTGFASIFGSTSDIEFIVSNYPEAA